MPVDSVTRRLVHLNRVAAVSFVLGGSLFALGAAFAQLDVGSLTTVNVTYLVGGFFFSLGGYALDPARVDDSGDRSRPRRNGSLVELPAARRAWRSAVVLFVGTLLFAVSLVAAFAAGAHATPVQRVDLAARHPRLRLLPRLGTPRHARGGRRPRPGPGRTSWAGGWWRSTSSAPSCSSSPGSRPSHVRRPPARSTSASSTGGRSPARSASRSGGVLQAFDTPTPTRTVVQHTP